MSGTVSVRKGDLDILIAACTSWAPPDLPAEAGEAFDRLLDAFDEAHAGDGAPVTRYALVEQLGHRAMVGTVREVTFCGKTMLEVRRTDVVPSVTVRVNPDTFYDVTDLSADQAAALARTYGQTTGGLDAAGVVTRYVSGRRQLAAAEDDELVDREIVDREIVDDEDLDGYPDAAQERDYDAEGNEL